MLVQRAALSSDSKPEPFAQMSEQPSGHGESVGSGQRYSRASSPPVELGWATIPVGRAVQVDSMVSLATAPYANDLIPMTECARMGERPTGA